MRGTAGTRDEHPDAARRGRLGVPEQVVGRAVGGHDPQLGGDAQLTQDPQRLLQDGEVRAAATDDTHDRRGCGLVRGRERSRSCVTGRS